jgi:hypothetical protein
LLVVPVEGSFVLPGRETENDYQSLKGSTCNGFVNENDCQIYNFAIGNYSVWSFFCLSFVILFSLQMCMVSGFCSLACKRVSKLVLTVCVSRSRNYT